MLIKKEDFSATAFAENKIACKFGYQIELDAWVIITKIPCKSFSSDRIGKELIEPLAEKLDQLAETETRHFFRNNEPR